MTYFTYPVVRDVGFAPNPFGGYCTLATCKPLIRKNAVPGNWVIGTSSIKGHKVAGRLIYAMLVEEKLTFDEYWSDPRFQYKKPIFNSSLKQCFGDNIYYFDKATQLWHQQNSHHSLDNGVINAINLKNDTRYPQVLISQSFYYFGGGHIEIPTRFKDEVCHNKRVPPHKIIDVKTGKKFISWLADKYGKQSYSLPAHMEKGFNRFDGKS